VDPSFAVRRFRACAIGQLTKGQAMMNKLFNTSSGLAIVTRMAADTPVSPSGNGQDAAPPPELQKAASKRKKAKAAEERTPLPDETEPAPKLVKGERTARDYDVSDIIADDSDEDEFSEPGPSAIRITTKLPKAKYIQAAPYFPNVRLRDQVG
jgi:hypothetical protein